MDLEQYPAKMILVPWDMMCDRTDRRTGEQKGQENRKDRRKGEQENRKDRRKEIQEIKKEQKKKTPKLTFRV